MQLSACVFCTGTHRGLRPSDPIRVREMLDEFFTHSDNTSAAFLAELRGLGLELPPLPFRVVTITPGMSDSPFTMDQAEQFAARGESLLPELLPADGVFYYTRGHLQGIVHADSFEELSAIYNGLRAVIDAPWGTGRPHAAISNPCLALNELSHACVENEEARVFERFITRPFDILLQPGDFQLIYDSTPEPPEDDDTYFGEMSQHICNAISAEDRARMHSLLDEVLNYMIGKFPRVSGVHMRAVHFCKPLEMTLIGADLIDRSFVQRCRLVQHVIEKESEAELRAAFHEKMDEMLEYSLQRRQQDYAALMHQVTEYIDANISDASLSILTIAEAFHLHPTKLSALFRKHYIDTIPEFIHRRRVNRLKELLLTTDIPVKELSRQSGYVSLATMNRAFIRLEGIAPGEYRRDHAVG